MNILERLEDLERRMNEVQNPAKHSAKMKAAAPIDWQLEELKKIIGVK